MFAFFVSWQTLGTFFRCLQDLAEPPLSAVSSIVFNDERNSRGERRISKKKRPQHWTPRRYSGGWRTWNPPQKLFADKFRKSVLEAENLFYRKQLTRKSSMSDFARILLQKTTSTNGSSFCLSTCGVPSIFETLLWKEPSLLHAKLIVVPPAISKPSRLISLSNRSCLCY